MATAAEQRHPARVRLRMVVDQGAQVNPPKSARVRWEIQRVFDLLHQLFGVRVPPSSKPAIEQADHGPFEVLSSPSEKHAALLGGPLEPSGGNHTKVSRKFQEK